METPLKNHALLGSKYRIDGKNGLINTDHQRIAQMINDLDPELTLAWIPSHNRLPTDDKPWALVKTVELTGDEYVVFNLREDQIDERLIGYIIHARTGDAETPMDRAEAMERARALAVAKKHEDQDAEARELAKAVLTSRKHMFKHGGIKYT